MRSLLTLLFAVLSIFIIGCKNQKATLSVAKNKNRLKKVTTLRNLLKRYDKNKLEYKTFSSKANVDYTFVQVSGANLSFNIRMKKDSIIWLSAKYGVVKVRLTPSKISFYNKLSRTYGEMTYKDLEKWIKTEMSFKFIQKLLVGDVAIDLNHKNIKFYQSKEKQYGLKLKYKNILGSIFINQETFHLNDQRYINEATESVLDVSYKYKNNITYPYEVNITITSDNKMLSINLKYSKVEINHQTKFPFAIPSTYKKISQ